MVSNIRDELLTVLSYLRPAQGASLSSRSLPYFQGQRSLRIAIDAVGSIHLLVPVPPCADARAVWRSRSIVVSRRTMDGDRDAGGTFLDIHCRRFELRDAFISLAELVITQLNGVELGGVENVVVETLENWRLLFGGAGSDTESLTGLMGELLILRDLAVQDPRALEAWTGPKGGRHDFRFGSKAIEVKTTLSQVGRKVQIHGASQMIGPEGGLLVLAFVRLETVPNGSCSLSSLVKEVVSAGVARAKLLEVLEAHDVDLSKAVVDEQKFEVREVRYYEVDERFPRITPLSFVGGALPQGVTDLSYGVELSSAASMQDDVAQSFISTFLRSNQ
jgi:hypothetical protein